MLKKLLIYFWSFRRQFIRYFITGVSAVLIDVASLYFLKEYFNFKPITAVIVNQLFLVNYVFLLNKFWAFQSSGMAHKQITKFYVLAGANYFFSIGWMWLGNEKLAFNYLLVRAANIALAVGWNFLLYKYWVYQESSCARTPLD